MRLTIRPIVVLALAALALASISLMTAGATGAAAADTVVVLEQDFEGGETAGISPLWDSGAPTMAWVPDPDDDDNTVLLVTDREDNWRSVSTPGHVGADEESFLVPGNEYTLSLRVRLANADDSPQSIRLTNGSDYSNLAGDLASASVTADAWTTLEGTYTPSSEEVTLYPEAAANVDILVDDFVLTMVQADEGGTPEPCVPETREHTSIDFEDDSYGPWSADDAATLEIVDGADGKVLSIDGSVPSYASYQSPPGAFEQGVTYTLSFEVRSPVATNVRAIANEPQASNEYEWVANTALDADVWTPVSDDWTFGANASTARFYLELDEAENYEIDNLLITYVAGCDEPGTGPAPGTVVIETGFEDGLDGWEPRNVGTGDHDVSITDEDANSGEHSALVHNRTSQGSGLGLDVTTVLEPLTQYELSAWVKFADGEAPDNISLSLQRDVDGAPTFSNLVAGTNMSNSEWREISGTFSTGGAWESAFLYFETEWEAEGVIANTSDFMVDDIRVSIPEAAQIQDLTPLQDTLDMPVGVAIDSRELSGPAAELTLKHFNQITAENHMKVESWYDGDQQFRRHSEATAMLDFAVENDLDVFGHVLVWHSQTPEWFFQDADGRDLTNSETDQQILRDRLYVHINNVAKSIYDDYGPYGSATNPMTGWDVVNEVVSDQAVDDGLRRSRLYDILGEEYIHLAFEYADEAFNETYAAAGSDRPVLMYINDYNTEQGLKGDQYEGLVRRMVEAGTPLDGVGHQFHLSVNASVDAMRDTMDRFVGMGLRQAITEFDVTINPANEANRVRQGHFYRDAFAMFRNYHENAPAEENLSSITIWGLTDTRSWRSEQEPLMFDGNFQAKPAYYGAVEDTDNLPGLITNTNVFRGDIALDDTFVDANEWSNLPENPMTGGVGGFQARWSDDNLTVLVRSTVDADSIEFTYEGEEFVFDSGSADSVAGVSGTAGGDYVYAAQLPHSGVSVGDTAEFDVRVLSDGQVAGAWNSPGALGQLTFFEELSFIEVPQLEAPTVDGQVDDVWSDVPAVTTNNTVEGSSDGAKADVRTLWQGDNLYVLFEVTDPVIDATNSDPWNKDGVELFLDLGNNKSGVYGPNDTQIRVTIEGDVSFGSGNTGLQQSRVLDHAVEITDDGYNVELAIALIGQSGGQSDVPLGGENVFHGVDFQVNDGRDGARYSVSTWAEPTGTGYQTTARWGVLQQVAELSDGGGDNGDGGPGDGGPGDGGPGDGGPGDGTDIITPLPEDEVTDQDEGGIDAPAQARAGDTITIGLGTDRAGVATQTFLYSEPTLIGQSIADADGNIQVTIPVDTAPGSHTIAVYDADGNLLGWASIDILAAADDSLATTGAEGFLLPLSIGLLLVLIGTAMVIRRQRSPGEDAARG